MHNDNDPEVEDDTIKSSLSKSISLTEMAAFWDEHDATDFDDHTCEVDIVFDLKFNIVRINANRLHNSCP